MAARRRNVRTILVAVFSCLGLLGITTVVLILRYGPVPVPIICETPFDAHEWRAADPLYSNVRLRMARNLDRRGVLIGKTRPEIEAMFGEPTTENSPPGKPALYYMVGTDPFDLLPESIYLVLEFAGGKVVAVRYTRS